MGIEGTFALPGLSDVVSLPGVRFAHPGLFSLAAPRLNFRLFLRTYAVKNKKQMTLGETSVIPGSRRHLRTIISNPSRLFDAQRDYWIDSSCTARGDVAGDKRNSSQQERDR
jgi:hypothetical protein